LIFDTHYNTVQVYTNGRWYNLVRPDANNNIKVLQGGQFQRYDGQRAAWLDDIPLDISQLTDNNNLLITPQEAESLTNIEIDGGGASSVYEVSYVYADGGFSSTRFGRNDTVFDGASAGSTYTNTLNGGGA